MRMKYFFLMVVVCSSLSFVVAYRGLRRMDGSTIALVAAAKTAQGIPSQCPPCIYPCVAIGVNAGDEYSKFCAGETCTGSANSIDPPTSGAGKDQVDVERKQCRGYVNGELTDCGMVYALRFNKLAAI
jgi:hypothetical protein